jgi:aryl-alcohol dehydrogenase-like predicted oxidoreductase
MEYRKMNGTGIRVSEICLGTMTFGEQVDDKESEKIINMALDRGINFIDTANAYHRGESERMIGNAIKGKRDNLIIASKVRYKAGDGVNDYGLSRRHIIEQIDKSLKRLQTDYIDIYYMHAIDPDMSSERELEETLDTMTQLVRSGKVRYIGVSNYPAWQICEMLWKSDKRNFIPPVVTQNMYNLVYREPEVELIPFLERLGMGMTVYNPVAGGLLTGKYNDGTIKKGTRFAMKESYINRYWNKETLAMTSEFTSFAENNGISLIGMSLNWCLSHKAVDSVICGISNCEQLKENIAAYESVKLNKEMIEECDKIYVKHKGERINYFKS